MSARVLRGPRLLLPLVGVCLLALVPYREFFSSHVPVGRDLLFYFYPLKAHLAEAVRAGQLPWIDRYRWGGAPLLGSPGAAPFDPGNLLFLLMPLGAAIKAWTLLRLVTAIAGFAFLSRRWGLSRGAAAVAGLAYGLSGVAVSLAPFPSTYAAVSILPWFAAFLLDVRRAPSMVRVALLSASAALLVLAGIPEFAFFATVIAIFLFFEKGTAAPAGRAALAVLGAAGIALFLGAAALLPAVDAASRSVRAPGGGAGIEAAAVGALPPVRLKEVLADGLVADWTRVGMAEGVERYPYLPSLTPGKVALLLALVGLSAGAPGKGRAFALSALGLVLALGDATPLWRLAARTVPFFTAVRFPEKYAVLAGFGLSWLAALGVAAFEKRIGEVSSRLPRIVMPLLAFAILVDRESIGRGLSPTDEGSVLTAAPSVLARLPRADGGGPPPRLFHRDSYAPVPVFDVRDLARASRQGRESLSPSYASLFGAAYQFELDYDVTLPQSAFEWTRLLTQAVPLPGPMPMRFLRAAGVAAVVETVQRPGEPWTPRLRLMGGALPPYRFASRMAVDSDGRRLFTRLLDEGFDPETAYVSGERAGVPAAPSRGEVVAVHDGSDALVLDVKVEGPSDGFLTLYRLKEAAIDARIDGRPAAVHDVAFGFAGVTVPPGSHHLRLRPDTAWVKIGVSMSVLTALLLCVATAAVWRRR